MYSLATSLSLAIGFTKAPGNVTNAKARVRPHDPATALRPGIRSAEGDDMTQRCDGIKMPDHYTAPTRRPSCHRTGYITADEMAWDMSEHWRTSAEWLAWIRRKDGQPRYWGKSRKWHYPVRPEVAAHCRPTSNSNRKLRFLP